MIPLNSWPRVRGAFSLVMGCGVVGIILAPSSYSWRSATVRPKDTVSTVREAYQCHRSRHMLVSPFHDQVRYQSHENSYHWLTLTWPFPHFGISMFSSLISFWPWNLTAFIMMLASTLFFDVAVLFYRFEECNRAPGFERIIECDHCLHSLSLQKTALSLPHTDDDGGVPALICRPTNDNSSHHWSIVPSLVLRNPP